MPTDAPRPVTETERQRFNGAAAREPSPESPPELNGDGLARERGMHAAAASRSLSERDMHAAAAAGVEELGNETVTIVNASGDHVVLPAHHVFDKAVHPLEVAAGRPLNGPGRRLCVAALRENPDGFRLIAEDAHARARVNPLGLLVRMVRDGDHRVPPGRLEAILAGHAKPDRAVDLAVDVAPAEPCPACGTGAGLHVADCELAPGPHRTEAAE